jgi:hypothetical protein
MAALGAGSVCKLPAGATDAVHRLLVFHISLSPLIIHISIGISHLVRSPTTGVGICVIFFLLDGFASYFSSPPPDFSRRGRYF